MECGEVGGGSWTEWTVLELGRGGGDVIGYGETWMGRLVWFAVPCCAVCGVVRCGLQWSCGWLIALQWRERG